MLRSQKLRTLSLPVVLALALGSTAYAQPGRPPMPDSHGDHDHGHDEGPAEPAAPKVYTPEDEARRKQVVARVQGAEITIAKIEDYINTQSPMMRARYQSPEELKKLVENMVRFELLAAEAERRDYGKNKTVVRTVKDSAVQNLLRADVEEKVTPKSISDAEVKAYYEANKDEFHREAMRRASYILVDTEAEAKKLLADVQKADARAFMELAKTHSKDLETKLRGGDLGFFAKEPQPTEPKIAAAVRKAAFDLKAVGDTSTKPIAVEGGFAIVRLTGERPERHTSQAEAEHPIRTKIWREKRQAALTSLIEGLRQKQKPEVHADKVDLVKLDDMEKQPGGFAPEPPGQPGKGPHGGPGKGAEKPAGHP
jgi:peptidyl-prolyl cis-trans isomerase C